MKQIYPFLSLAVMAASLNGVGVTQAGGKPKAVIAQASPLYKTQSIPCPVALPFETEGKTVTCGVLRFAIEPNHNRNSTH